jgi:hypothetical protein
LVPHKFFDSYQLPLHFRVWRSNNRGVARWPMRVVMLWIRGDSGSRWHVTWVTTIAMMGGVIMGWVSTRSAVTRHRVMMTVEVPSSSTWGWCWLRGEWVWRLILIPTRRPIMG